MRRLAAWVFIAVAILVFFLWGYVRSDWANRVRLELVVHGYPFAEMRFEAPGSRHPHAEDFGLAYRRSVYSRGRYVGCVERFGYFERPGEEFPNPFPLLVVGTIYNWGKYISPVLLFIGMLILLSTRANPHDS